MAKKNYYDITLSFAGLFQAAALAKRMAHTNVVDETYYLSSIRSLFVLDPVSVKEVYGGIEQVRLGLDILHEQLVQKHLRDPEILRYVVNLIQIERLISKKPELSNELIAGIQRAKEQSEIFSITHENVIANLAHLYKEKISTLPLRIMVAGNPSYIQTPKTADTIRVLLLCGLRSAVLWRQVGGSRFQLLFASKKIARIANELAHFEPEQPNDDA